MMDRYYVKLIKAALNPKVVLHRLALPADHKKTLLVDGVSYKWGSSVELEGMERFRIKDEHSENQEGDLIAVASKTKDKECRCSRLNRREAEESIKEDASSGSPEDASRRESENSGDSEAENRPNSTDEMETDSSESDGSDHEDDGGERLGSGGFSTTRGVVSEESSRKRKTIRL